MTPLNNVYYIPANYTDAGRLLGIFAIRNAIEAVIITVPLFFLLMSVLPFATTTTLVIALIIVIPAGGFALIGINDDSLTSFFRIWQSWRNKRGILTYRGNISFKYSSLRGI